MPTISFFLAQILGIYVILMGVSVLLRREELDKSFRKMFSSGGFTYYLGALVLLLGLFLVQIHNIWDGSWRVAVTVFAWMALLKGAAIILIPSDKLGKMMEGLMNANLFRILAFIIIAYGAYMAAYGFSLIP